MNHCISKKLVRLAKDTQRAIALEALTYIRSRIRLRRRQRARHHGWGFSQLRSFIEYKATLAGVSVVVIAPKHTSQSCAQCGYVAKQNRKSQALFVCKSCGHTEHADVNAARNIRAKAVVSLPKVAAFG